MVSPEWYLSRRMIGVQLSKIYWTHLKIWLTILHSRHRQLP